VAATTSTAAPTTIPLPDDSDVVESVDPVDIPPDTDPPAQEGLPADGPATVAGVALPSGALLETNGARLAWITDDNVPDVGAKWLALYAAREQTGLYPVILIDRDEPRWERDSFFPNAPEEIDQLKLEEVFQSWAESFFDTPPKLPDLTVASTTENVAAADAAVKAFTSGRLALVESPRGADALSYMGWTGNSYYDSAEALALVVRSWEDRFGARVVAVGREELVVVLTRPPATAAAARSVSDELLLADPDIESGDIPKGVEIVKVGSGLAGQPVWHFWWGGEVDDGIIINIGDDAT
jgi:hypothetical protein